jgi:hypothetical protein
LVCSVEAIAYIRGVRLDLNRNLTDAKLEIKENAIKLFMEHLDTLLEADKDASDTFKKGNVSWSEFNSLIFAETSTMSLSFAIFSPFSLSASDLALTIKSCSCLILSTDTLLNSIKAF